MSRGRSTGDPGVLVPPGKGRFKALVLGMETMTHVLASPVAEIVPLWQDWK